MSRLLFYVYIIFFLCLSDGNKIQIYLSPTPLEFDALVSGLLSLVLNPPMPPILSITKGPSLMLLAAIGFY